jgi:hypothetical protein
MKEGLTPLLDASGKGDKGIGYHIIWLSFPQQVAPHLIVSRRVLGIVAHEGRHRIPENTCAMARSSCQSHWLKTISS